MCIFLIALVVPESFTSFQLVFTEDCSTSRGTFDDFSFFFFNSGRWVQSPLTLPSWSEHSGNFWVCEVFVMKLFWHVLVYRLEKAVTPHSSTLAWKIPWTEEPGRLQSMGSPRVRHDWVTSLSLFTCKHWRRKWQPTPVFFLGESQGRGSLVGCRLWGHTESDTTEVT